MRLSSPTAVLCASNRRSLPDRQSGLLRAFARATNRPASAYATGDPAAVLPPEPMMRQPEITRAPSSSPGESTFWSWSCGSGSPTLRRDGTSGEPPSMIAKQTVSALDSNGKQRGHRGDAGDHIGGNRLVAKLAAPLQDSRPALRDGAADGGYGAAKYLKSKNVCHEADLTILLDCALQDNGYR